MMKRLVLFSLVLSCSFQVRPAFAASTVTVINRTNQCVVVEASMFRPTQGGWARPTRELQPDGQATFNFAGARDMDIRADVKNTSRCNSGTLVRVGPYKTDVKGDRLKVVRTSQFQIVRD